MRRLVSSFRSLGLARPTSTLRSNALRRYSSDQPIPSQAKRQVNLNHSKEDFHIEFLDDPLLCITLNHRVPSPPGPLVRYRSLVELGKLQHDPYQEKVASELENLLVNLEKYEKDMEKYHENLSRWEENRENERRRLLLEEAEAKQQGGVLGSAKQLQNGYFGRWMSWEDNAYGMFYNATEGIVRHRRRFHFHETSAMLEVHEHMHKIWKNQVEEKSMQSSIGDWIMNLPFDTRVKEWVAAEERYKQEVQMKNILPAVADKFLVDHWGDQRGASILCFDEIQTVDVFAIVALSGIVSRLLSTGTVLVATSNRAPKDLNQDGTQWEIFLKFTAKLGEHCHNILIGSDIDYRRVIAKRSIDQVHYFWSLNKVAIDNFENMWDQITRMCGGGVTSNTILVMFGRYLLNCTITRL
ncbi:hypothetical protein RJ639_001904 [Escallonia herrerae]|uniref:Mitochondrial ATPase n=1 Tax=Escallonia herrerae TaxID=1293975 RepID=A0AA89BJU0_9ASTE|nr:hypothetical protein RJ639_001904 [Escallonia herrerae]